MSSRPTIKFPALDMDNREIKRRLVTEVGALTGMYEVELKPKRSTRTLKQNAAWWALVVEPLFRFLRAQEYDIYDPDQAHEMLKVKLLRIAVVCERTGEVLGYRTRSTTELSTTEFADLYDRARAWLDDKFGIQIPDPDPDWRENQATEAQRGLASRTVA